MVSLTAASTARGAVSAAAPVNVTGGEPIGAGEGAGVSRAPSLGRLEHVEAATTVWVDATIRQRAF
jgi:hypothetical protein